MIDHSRSLGFGRLILASILCVCCAAQVTPQGFSVTSSRAPEAVKPDDSFTSLDGRFIVGLPKLIAAYRPVSFDSPAGRVTGQTFTWSTAQGDFVIAYVDRPESLEANSKFFLDSLRDSVAAKAREGKGELRIDKEFTLGTRPGRELRFELPESLLVMRLVIDKQRLYQATLSLTKARAAQEAAGVAILDSFRLLDAAGVEAAKRKMVIDATPPALPQSPRGSRRKSDLEDDRINGKVKTIFTESEDLTGKSFVPGRKPSSLAHYNELGDLVKRESWDYRGNVSDIQTYGYIDGERVSNFGSIRYEYNPPPALAPPAPAGQPPVKPDPRYDTRRGYKYDDRGVLIEETYYNSSGRINIRYVYNRIGNQLERLAYTTDGKLNQKSISTLDARGNAVERADYDVKTDLVRSRSKYVYEFDAQGNWIKYTTLEQDMKTGTTEYKASYISYRTITYY